jgi:hypothetical protein
LDFLTTPFQEFENYSKWVRKQFAGGTQNFKSYQNNPTKGRQNWLNVGLVVHEMSSILIWGTQLQKVENP